MGDNKFTPEETRAINSLKRLAKRWPSSLMLFSWSGTLMAVKLNPDGSSPLHDNPSNATYEDIPGIRNDGGDPS